MLIGRIWFNYPHIQRGLRGEGDALAADVYAQAYTKDPDFYALYRSLNAYKRGSGLTHIPVAIMYLL